MRPVELHTTRLLLSLPTEEDIPALVDMCQDPEISQWTSVPSPYTAEDARSFLTSIVIPGWESGNDYVWMIRARDQARTPLGQISLRQLHLSLGFMLTQQARGKGYMGEALDAVLDFAFHTLDWPVVRWACEIHEETVNWASARVVWRAGFTFEGRERASILNKGARYDGLVASLAADEPRTPRNAWFGPDERHAEIGDSTRPEDLVRVFHETYGLPVFDNDPNADRERVHMRLALVAEEVSELVGAVYGKRAQEIMMSAFEEAHAADDGSRDTVEVADALGDLVYVAYGMALELGISMRDVLAEIQASNLSKLGADGKPIYREDGKVLKGPNYFRPDIAKVLGLSSV